MAPITPEALLQRHGRALLVRFADRVASGQDPRALVLVLAAPALRANGRTFVDILDRQQLVALFADLLIDHRFSRRPPPLPEPTAHYVPIVVVTLDASGMHESHVYRSSVSSESRPVVCLGLRGG